MFYRKWKIKNVIVLDLRSATHFEAFLMKQGMLSLHISNVLGMCRGMHVRWQASYAKY